jgi:hypothetical protein
VPSIDERLERIDYSMSTSTPIAAARRYHILTRERHEGLLDDIFNRKHLAADLSLYLHHSTTRPTSGIRSTATSAAPSW